MSEPILKDLCVLIRKSAIHYNETCEQKDVILTEEFQEKFGNYLRENNYTVDFYEHTAVISTPVGNYMFVPNQWFVIAAYAVGVYTELMKYKTALLSVCNYMGEKPKTFIPKLRNDVASTNRTLFFEGCKEVFKEYDNEATEQASKRLWRFATDYSWWSGNKTVDRTDFHLSVILNMLSLVNTSQSFVAEIVSDYCKSGLAYMVADLSDFTINVSGATYEISDYIDPKENADETTMKVHESLADYDSDVIIIKVKSKE